MSESKLTFKEMQMTDTYVFRVLFLGLCGYVPNRTLDDPGTPPTRMRVLLPEGIRSADKLGLQHHLPALVLPLENLKDLHGSQPDLVFDDPRTGQRKAFFDLYGLDVSLQIGAATPNTLQVAPGALASPEPGTPPTGAEAKRFAWVPRLDIAAEADGAGHVDGSVWGASPDTARVVTRIAVTSGRLQTHELALVGGRVSIWEFRKLGQSAGTGTLQQAVADTVAWEHDVPASQTVTLEAKRFDGSPKHTLKLGPASGTSEVEMDISSLAWEEILGVAQSDPPDELRDLQILYRLTPAVDPDPDLEEPKLPIPHFVAPGGIGRPAHCPEGVLAPDPEA